MGDASDSLARKSGGAGRFGVRAKLWLAFGSVATMTVVASVVALRSFDVANDTLNRISQRQLPVMAALSHLEQQGNLLLATVPSLIHAESLDTLHRQAHAVTQAEEDFIAAQNQVRAALEDFGGGERIDAIGELAARIGAHLQILQSAMEHRWLLMAQQRSLIERIHPLGRRSPHLLLPVIAEHIPQASTAQLAEIEQEIARLSWIDSPLRNDLARLIGLRRTEIQALSLAAKQLERIRFLSGNLDAEARRLIDAWQAASAVDRAAMIDSMRESRMILMLASGLAVAGALAVAWLYVGRRVVRRIAEIEASMRNIAGGDFDAPIPAGGNDEISRMATALSVFRDAMRSVAHQARHDSLTGLLNRNGLMEMGGSLIGAKSPGALIYFNLEAFKEINDTFGHDAGDHVLSAVAERLRRVALPDWLLARLGGDDFAALVPDCDEGLAIQHAARIQKSLASPVASDVLTIDLRAAIGIVCYPRFGNTPRELLQRADLAMNAARTRRETPVLLYEPALGTAAERHKTVRSELRHALETGQFHLVYQPKVDIASNRVSGVEALIRWAHPQRGLISPADFIPIAERSGLILPLGAWVLETACRQAKDWMDMDVDISVAINFSASQFLQPDVVEDIERALAETGLPPERLEIEITESVLLRDEVEVLRRLHDLRNCGVALALDDFGTGYSSLSYLKRLPVTGLKIDQSFVRDMFLRDDDTRITSAIIRMAHDLGLSVVAEGIENARQLAFFRDADCDLGQGYLFAKPMAAAAIPAFAAAAGGAS
jgi:diguanylate cyclase (GGDEF)-like protein